MDETQPPTAERLQYVVIAEREDGERLPIGTRLEEVRRFDKAYEGHQSAFIREVIAEMRVIGGPQTGATFEVSLEWGFGYDPPTWRATWLTRLAAE